MVGKIINASTSAPARRLNPSPPKLDLIMGTNTVRPIQPYTTEGMPTKISTTG